MIIISLALSHPSSTSLSQGKQNMKFFSRNTSSTTFLVYLVAVVLLPAVAEGFTLSHGRRHKHVGTNKVTGRRPIRQETVSPSSTAPTRTTTSVVASSGAARAVSVDAATTAVPQAESWRRQQQRQQQLDEKRREIASQIAMIITSLVSSVSSSLHSTTIKKRINTSRNNKLWNLSNDELADIIVRDGREKQFLFTADLTREIYDERCLFCDGSDLDGSYPIDAWVRGCQFLFDSKESSSRILEDTLRVSSHRVKFAFEEQLQFNMIPSFLRRSLQRVSLTGSIIMDRDPQTGLIVQYQEVWDQSLGQLMKQLWTVSQTTKRITTVRR